MADRTRAPVVGGLEQLKNLVSHNMLASVGTNAVYLASRLLLPPMILAYVPLDAYGIWTCCFILVAYVGMSGFGIANVYIRYVAAYAASGDTDRINALVSTGTALLGTVSLVLLAGLAFVLPHLIAAFHIAEHLRRTAFILMYGTVAVFTLELCLGTFAFVLEGVQRMAVTKIVWLGTSLLEAVAIVVLLHAGFGIYALLWAFGLRYVLAVSANAVLAFRAVPTLSIRPRHVSREAFGVLWSYGGIVQLSGLLGMFLRSVQRVLAGTFIGVAAAGLFDVGEKLPMMAASVPASMTAALLPASAQLHAQGHADELLKLYLKSSRYLSMLMGLGLGFMAAFAAPLVTAWLGPRVEFGPAATILAWFTIAWQMNNATGPASAVFQALGRPVRELVYPLLQVVLLLVTVPLAFALLGRTVTAVAVSVATTMVVAAIGYIAFANRCLRIAQWTWVRRVLLPGLLPYGVGAVLAWAAQPWTAAALGGRPAAFGLLAVAGAAYGLVVPQLLYRALCDGSEREFLRRQFLHTTGKMLPRRLQRA